MESLRRKFGLSPWLVLAGSLGFTLASALFTRWYGNQRDELRFENAVEATGDRILARLEIYRAALRGGSALFAARQSITPDEFHRYVQRLNLQQRYPGIQGIGFSERIASNIPGPIDERHEIRFLEPLDARNRAAIGYDMYSEPVRRAAMQRARDTGVQAMTGKVTLVQEISGPKQPGFLIYSPIYTSGAIPATVPERRRLLEGFSYAPFRTQDLFSGIFGSEQSPRVRFSVYDGPSVAPSDLLYASPGAADHHPAYRAKRAMQIANHQWTVVYASEPAFEEQALDDFTFGMFVLLGVLASLWLFWFSRGQALARRQAEVASKARGAFLATMSHELRTPLNAIGGYVDLMQLEIPGALNQQQQSYLERIERAQKHLLGLINNILNYSKLEAKHVQFSIGPVSVAHAVANTELLVLPQMQAAGLIYTNRGGPPVSVRADLEKLTQILLNLLSNATKFTPRDGQISVWWEKKRDNVLIHIADTGMGIPKGRMESIFDPFVQIDADLTRTAHGTGLGLSIARELARAMRGDLTAESELHKGSEFTVCLPLAAVQQRTPAEESSTGPQS